MTWTTTRLAVLPIAVALVGLTLAAPGHSEVTRPRDDRGDVAKIRPDGSVTTARVAASVDIVELTTRYGPRRLTMATHVVDLDARPHGRLGPGWQFRTPRPGRWSVIIYKPRGDAQVTLVHHHDAVSCPGATFSRQPRRNLYRATVPATCFGSPRWVRTGGAVGASQFHPWRMWVDDARAGRLDGMEGYHFRLGRKISRS